MQKPSATTAAPGGGKKEIGDGGTAGGEEEVGVGGSVRVGALRSRALEVVRGVEEAGVRAVPSAEDGEAADGAGSIMRWGRPQARNGGLREDRRSRMLRAPCGSEVCLHRGWLKGSCF